LTPIVTRPRGAVTHFSKAGREVVSFGFLFLRVSAARLRGEDFPPDAEGGKRLEM
jgi:hypothetical protein